MPLFEHFTLAAARRFNCDAPIADERLVSRLLSFSWPGNVRELRNVADRFVLGVLDDTMIGNPDFEAIDHSLPRQLETVERAIVEDALRRKKGDINAAATLLSVPKQTFYDKIKRLAIDVEAIRGKSGDEAGS